MNFHQIFTNIKCKKPLIHNITNYVTVNDCANIILAIGASPIMADAIEETEAITSISQGLNINLGTLNKRTIESMVISGIRANKTGVPVILDPVGAGASAFRTDTAKMLIEKINFSVIRGNISEIKTLYAGAGMTHGVDALSSDEISGSSIKTAAEIAHSLAEKNRSVIAISGKYDIISDGIQTVCIKNGHPLMGKITGSGCMLSALIAAFSAANPDNIFNAAAAATITMCIAGELAAGRMKSKDGNSSYRNYLIDAVFNMTSQELSEGANYEFI